MTLFNTFYTWVADQESEKYFQVKNSAPKYKRIFLKYKI